MKKALAAVAIVAAALVAVSAPAGAAPPIEKLPKNAFVIPITCEGVNDGEPFLIWGSNVKGNVNGNAGLVGHPLGVDVPWASRRPSVREPPSIGRSRAPRPSARSTSCRRASRPDAADLSAHRVPGAMRRPRTSAGRA